VNKLRIVGTVAAGIGAVVSLLLLLNTGKSTPPLLLVMFIGWVALPFAALGIGILRKGLSDSLHCALSITSIVVAVVSIAVYAYFTIFPLAATPARTWLLTPGFSLVAIAAVFLFVRLRR
jgi:hypothetical protein